MAGPSRRLRPTPARSAYVLIVAVTAAVGFTTGSTAVIALAALLSLPASIVAVPAYYLAYGLLALVPGANPATAAGSGSCTPTGDCISSTTGDVAAWLTYASETLGVLLLAAAALVNVVVLRHLTARRSAPTGC